jgi:hypothetical protein
MGNYRVRPGVTALFAGLALVLAATARVQAQNVGVPVFSTLKESLAIVAAPDGKDYALGTAFCIESDDKRSILLTNAHVVGGSPVVGIRLETDHKWYRGFVLRTSVAPLDAAVIEIQKANVPVLRLASTRPAPGAPIAVAGYPSIQLNTDLNPSVHAGIVNDIMQSFYIEMDATVDHGNSGGPLFNGVTGDVYGIVTSFVPSQSARAVQNNFAISIDRAFAFLQNAGVHPSFVSDVAAVPATTPAPALLAAAPDPTPSDSWNVTVPIPSPAPSASDSWNVTVPIPDSPATPSVSSSTPATSSDSPDALYASCVDAVKQQAYSHGVAACTAYERTFEESMKSITSKSLPEALPTLHDAFRATSLLAVAYKGTGDAKNGHANAIAACELGYLTARAVFKIDPHLYNAAHRDLHTEIGLGFKALESLYPGIMDELKRDPNFR